MSEGTGKGRGKGRGVARGKQQTAVAGANQPVMAGAAGGAPPVAQPPLPAGKAKDDPRAAEEAGKQVTVAASRSIRMREAGADQTIVSILKRPGYGTVGKRFRVQANYFQMRIGEGKRVLIVNHYEWDLAPGPGASRRLDRDERRDLFWRMAVKEGWPINKLAFDDSKAIYTVDKLPLEGAEKDFEIMHQLHSDGKEWPYKFRVKDVGIHEIDLAQTVREIHAERTTTSAQIIDIIITQAKRCPVQDPEYEPFANGWYPFKNCIYRMPNAPGAGPNIFNLGGGREIWTGFSTACKVGENPNRPLINIDVARSVFFKEIDCLEFMCEVFNDDERSKAGGNGKPKDPPSFQKQNLDAGTVLDERLRQILHKAMNGMRFRTIHLVTHNRDFKYVKLNASAKDVQFRKRGEGGVESVTNVADYFAEKYSPLKFPSLPTISLGSKTKHHEFPMECLMVYSPQKCTKKCSVYQNADMIKSGAEPADKRHKHIMDLVGQAFANKDPFRAAFEIEVNTKMLECEARQLDKPSVLYNQGKRANVREGGWQTHDVQFLQPATVPAYAIINFSKVPVEVLQTFCKEIVTTSVQRGIRWVRDMPSYVVTRFGGGERYDPKSPEFSTRLRAEFAQCKDACIHQMIKEGGVSEADARNAMILVFCILDGKDGAVYSRVKYLTEISEQGVKTERDQSFNVMTQCLQMKTVKGIASPNSNRGVNATAENVAMKINMKMGGINNGLQSNMAWQKYTGGEGATMFMGVDVTHPGVGDNVSPSVAAVVSNTNLEATRYSCSVKIQKNRREHIVYLYDAVRERVMDFWKRTGCKPDRIIVYRDGVSEGQFIDVLKEEMGSVRAGCQYLDPKYCPPITYIVVQKRHHTRFFPEQSMKEGRANNIPAGTVVDRGVTHPTEYDFFLCSHGGGMGTSRPTHYYVLHDENHMDVNELQMLTYQLTHVYGRCPKSVSIPAPCYFADLCCTRARAHLQGAGEGSSSSYGSQDDSGRCGRGGESSDASSSVGGSSASSEELLTNKVSVYWTIKEKMYFA